MFSSNPINVFHNQKNNDVIKRNEKTKVLIEKESPEKKTLDLHENNDFIVIDNVLKNVETSSNENEDISEDLEDIDSNFIEQVLPTQTTKTKNRKKRIKQKLKRRSDINIDLINLTPQHNNDDVSNPGFLSDGYLTGLMPFTDFDLVADSSKQIEKKLPMSIDIIPGNENIFKKKAMKKLIYDDIEVIEIKQEGIGKVSNLPTIEFDFLDLQRFNQ